MGGRRGALLMQTSGFATIANVIASLAVPCQIPLIMFVSERGTLGEFNLGQALVARTMRPVLQSLAMEHHAITRLDEFEFIVDRGVKQAIATQAPVADPLAAADRRQDVRGSDAMSTPAARLAQHQGHEPLRSDDAPRRRS